MYWFVGNYNNNEVKLFLKYKTMFFDGNIFGKQYVSKTIIMRKRAKNMRKTKIFNYFPNNVAMHSVTGAVPFSILPFLMQLANVKYTRTLSQNNTF